MKCTALKEVVMPEGLQEIGVSAFNSCSSLEKAVIPSSVTNIGESAFKVCSSLKSIQIPSGVNELKKETFWLCESLTEVTIPVGVTVIGEGVFSSCLDLAKIVIPEGVTSIGADAFEGCLKLKKIAIPASVTNIGNQAFLFCDGLNVYYAGTEETWNNIVFDRAENEELVDAKLYYNADGIPEGCPHTNTTLINKKVPTCSAAGYTGDEMCVVCTEIVKQGTAIPVAAHNPVTIVTKATTISKVSAQKKGFKAAWKKQSSQTTGYQLQYSTSSKFKSAKTVTITKNKTTSKSISRLKAKKKYYVRIRTYKTVKINGKTIKLYSAWSKAKIVTTKK